MFGYSVQTVSQFQEALRRHVEQNEVHEMVESEYGKRYVVQCCIPALSGVDPCVSTVWIVEKGMPEPRLVTAYPVNRGKQ